jgi:hypothetical protein
MLYNGHPKANRDQCRIRSGVDARCSDFSSRNKQIIQYNTSARRAFYSNVIDTSATIKLPKGIIKAFYRKWVTKVPIWVTKVTLP